MRSGGRCNKHHNFEVVIGVNGLSRLLQLHDIIRIYLLFLWLTYN